MKQTAINRNKTVYFKSILSLLKLDTDKIGLSWLFCKAADHHLCYPKNNIDKKPFFITVLLIKEE